MSTKDYLQGMPLELTNQFETRIVDDIPSVGSVTQTTQDVHYYADGTSGSDLNDGLTALTPKKSLEAVFNLIPFLVKHNVGVHLTGVFQERTTAFYITKSIEYGKKILIDGGPDVTQLFGPFTSDDANTDITMIGYETAGWTPDAYAGYWVEIINCPAFPELNGQKRAIHESTAKTIIPVRNFTQDPGPNTTFRIVRPSTELRQVTSFPALYFSNVGQGTLIMQRFYGNNYSVGVARSLGAVYFLSFVSASTSRHSITGTGTFGVFQIEGSVYNPMTFLSDALASSYIGCGIRGNWSYGVSITNGTGFIYGLYTTTIQIVKAVTHSYGYGLRCEYLYAQIHSHITNISSNTSSGYARTKFGKTGIGIPVWITNSMVQIGSGVDISFATYDAIRAQNNSYLVLNGAVQGINGGSGCVATACSVVIQLAPTATLTGPIGEGKDMVLNLIEGGQEFRTWVQLQGAGRITSTGEYSIYRSGW
jgi:hypothetical protein